MTDHEQTRALIRDLVTELRHTRDRPEPERVRIGTEAIEHIG